MSFSEYGFNKDFSQFFTYPRPGAVFREESHSVSFAQNAIGADIELYEIFNTEPEGQQDEFFCSGVVDEKISP